MTTRISLGRFGSPTATATRFAELAVHEAAKRGRETMIVLLDLRTGEVSLDVATAPVPPGTFARGVRFDTDPDILADDLREEADNAGLIEVLGKARTRRKAARKSA